jgi:hypothetical protein
MHPIKQRSLGIAHISMNRAPAPADGQDDEVPAGCCIGSAVYGPGRCTCWQPVFDETQAPARVELEPETRVKCCDDCAYRPGSPEDDEIRDELRELNGTFWCHVGMRRPRAYRHPSGVERPGNPMDYQPLVIDGVPYRADGTPAARCAGWSAHAQKRS